MSSMGLGLTLERRVSYHQSVKMKSEKAKKTFITALLFFGFNFKYVYLFFVYVSVWMMCVGGGAHVWRSDNMLQELFICFHHVGPKG